MVAAPATLAFTGVGQTFMTVTVSVATSGIVLGIVLLRTARVSLFKAPSLDLPPGSHD